MAESAIAAIRDIIYPELTANKKLSYTGENYLIWKLKISFVLSSHGFDNILNNPNPLDPEWVTYNRVARLSLILPALDDQLRYNYCGKDHNTAMSILESLEERFNYHCVSRKMYLLKCYRECRMVPDTPVNKHIFKMRSMAKVFEYAGAKFPDEFHAAMLLDSLPDVWREDVERLMFELDSSKQEFNFENVSRRLRIANDTRRLKAFNSGRKGFCKDRRESYEKASSIREQWLENLDIFPLPFGYMEYLFFKIHDRLESSGADFSYWASKLQSILEKNKLSHVLCDEKPADGDHKQTKWLADDLDCRHFILGALDDELFLSFHDYPTARSPMDALSMFFKCSSADRVLRFKKFMDHQMSEDTPVRDHIDKIDKLRLKLRSSGITFLNEMQAVSLMNSLPDSWADSMVVMTINMDVEKVELWDVQRKIRGIGELRQLLAYENVVGTSNAHYGSKHTERLNGNCYACGRAGHYKSNCPNRATLR